jgi:hypothetical protein
MFTNTICPVQTEKHAVAAAPKSRGVQRVAAAILLGILLLILVSGCANTSAQRAHVRSSGGGCYSGGTMCGRIVVVE